jgi:hypothetical protein
VNALTVKSILRAVREHAEPDADHIDVGWRRDRRAGADELDDTVNARWWHPKWEDDLSDIRPLSYALKEVRTLLSAGHDVELDLYCYRWRDDTGLLSNVQLVCKPDGTVEVKS